MTEDASAQSLHDRATRGGVLTDAERAALDAWYERQDRAEAALLGADAPGTPVPLNSLRGEIEAALIRLREETQRIQSQEKENEMLRRENAALLRRLTETKTPVASGRPA